MLLYFFSIASFTAILSWFYKLKYALLFLLLFFFFLCVIKCFDIKLNLEEDNLAFF
jgi:hypothetical protein